MTAPAAALVVRAPPRRLAELRWVCGVLFDRWLGLPARVAPADDTGGDVVLQVDDGGGGRGELRWRDDFLAGADARWLAADSLPAPEPEPWTLPDAELARRIGEPALPRWFGDGRFEAGPGVVRLPIDLTGSAFFVLSRYEEAVAGAAADRHGRFPGRASLAQRAGLGLRPLVDEWVELLWWAIERVAPGLRRRPREASTWVSCDVDAPYSPAGEGWARALRQTASHLVNDRSPRLAAQALLHATASRVAGVQRFDAFDTFDWMLAANERAGRRASFFFLSLHDPAPIDGCYTLAEPRIAALLRRILERGHELGLHGSYGSVDDAAAQAAELAGLRDAAASAGGDPAAVAGGRQHYLRWRAASSARQLDALGLRYDSTLGFADAAGFRCGTCHAYPLFDLAEGRALAIVERPLVMMEVTVTSPVYLGLGHGDAAAALMLGLRERCRRFGGEFSLLWHNSNLALPEARALYQALLG